MIRFILTFPRHLKRNIVIAGGLFIGGAIGIEILSGLLHGSGADQPLLALTYIVTEEMMEMSAISLFVASLGSLFIIDDVRGRITISR